MSTQTPAGPLFVSTFGPPLSATGEGRPILGLHGVEAHGVRFIGLASHMPGTTIVAPDLRGHGRSHKNGPWTVEQHVRDLLPLLRRLGPRTILLGHSFGGLVAWELARAAHDHLAALILVDPAIAMAAEDIQGYGDSPQPRWPNIEAALHHRLTGRSGRAHWSVALDVAVGVERDTDGSLRPAAAPEVVSAIWRQVTTPLEPSAWRGPTLLIEAGRENGLYCSPALIADLHEQLGDQLSHVVLDVVHTITADNPELLAEHVGAFMARL